MEVKFFYKNIEKYDLFVLLFMFKTFQDMALIKGS